MEPWETRDLATLPGLRTQTADALSWSTETFAQNQNANAIRWGTLYNFRFDSNQPPQATNATIGFFKTGTPVLVGDPGPECRAMPTPTPTPDSVSAGNRAGHQPLDADAGSDRG